MAEQKNRRPSFSLLLAGLLGLGVSVWAFIGPHSWPVSGGLSLGWIVVIAAIVVGIVLVLSPRKNSD
ncbi:MULTISPECIES: hypothetical protein [unclassified Nocardia]|uniref:hypothetical protein n=1 Tax=unclassified Nocardia TaxID=2637762 RepID=UPI002623C6BD|nr:MULTISPECIES: hypothetical protein [unclassified Nocardia]MCU1645807.1 hypothetical protein [Nocardia sp.]WSJ17210.1 hypothetical protein OG326_07280 [Nocardia sp. NBC_01327]